MTIKQLEDAARKCPATTNINCGMETSTRGTRTIVYGVVEEPKPKTKKKQPSLEEAFRAHSPNLNEPVRMLMASVLSVWPNSSLAEDLLIVSRYHSLEKAAERVAALQKIRR